MAGLLLGLIGIAICGITGYEAVTYWRNTHYVNVKEYAMMGYYGIIGLCGIACICC